MRPQKITKQQIREALEAYLAARTPRSRSKRHREYVRLWNLWARQQAR